MEGYTDVDPSHPLGGPDGGRDLKCMREGARWIAAVYFPRGQKVFAEIKAKFSSDLMKASEHEAEGFLFLTNQELRLAEREDLYERTRDVGFEVGILHLERISTLLGSPRYYGIRLEFLDIEMTKEEQLAFLAARDESLASLQRATETISLRLAALGESGQEASQALEATPAFRVQPEVRFATTGCFGLGIDCHKCSYCGFGFYRQGDAFATASIFHHVTVTCPKCGNTDYVRRGLDVAGY